MPGTILLVLVAVSLFCALATHAATHLALFRRPAKPRAPLPPITILKPLCGFDEDLDENLSSLAEQDYPAPIQIVLGAEDSRDPALDAARRLRDRFPSLDVLIVHCDRPLGLNPKVNNLSALLARARFDVVLVSDSNVRARPGYLRAIASELVADPRVELVCNPVVGAGEKSAGAVLETLQLATFATAAVCASSVLGGPACVIGKSMLFRRRDLEQLGGWWPLRSVLAEDYVLGRAFELLGYRVALSPYVIGTVNDGWTIERFVNRHLRWAQMRRRVSPLAFAGELILNPVLWIAIAALASRDLRLCLFGALGVAIKCAADALVLRRLGPPPRLRQLLAVPFKDLLLAGVWGVGAFRRTIDWRGTRMRIEAGSQLVPIAADERVVARREQGRGARLQDAELAQEAA